METDAVLELLKIRYRVATAQTPPLPAKGLPPKLLVLIAKEPGFVQV